jgi:hypothetical protein
LGKRGVTQTPKPNVLMYNWNYRGA